MSIADFCRMIARVFSTNGNLWEPPRKPKLVDTVEKEEDDARKVYRRSTNAVSQTAEDAISRVSQSNHDGSRIY